MTVFFGVELFVVALSVGSVGGDGGGGDGGRCQILLVHLSTYLLYLSVLLSCILFHFNIFILFEGCRCVTVKINSIMWKQHLSDTIPVDQKTAESKAKQNPEGTSEIKYLSQPRTIANI